MMVSTIVMGVLALCLYLIAYHKGGDGHITGLKSSFTHDAGDSSVMGEKL